MMPMCRNVRGIADNKKMNNNSKSSLSLSSSSSTMMQPANLSDSEDDLPIGDLIKKRGREGKLPTAKDIANRKSKAIAAAVKKEESKTKPATISDNNNTPGSMLSLIHISEPTRPY